MPDFPTLLFSFEQTNFIYGTDDTICLKKYYPFFLFLFPISKQYSNNKIENRIDVAIGNWTHGWKDCRLSYGGCPHFHNLGIIKKWKSYFRYWHELVRKFLLLKSRHCHGWNYTLSNVECNWFESQARIFRKILSQLILPKCQWIVKSKNKS